MTGITVDLEDMAYDPRVQEYIMSEIKKTFKMDEEMVVEVDCPYAQYVEFGSDPYSRSNGKKTTKVPDLICKDEVTEVNLRIRDWVSTKYMATPQERKKRGDNIYRTIMEKGMRPEPFIRPAKFVVREDVIAHPGRYFKPGENITEKIAHQMKVEMENALMQHGSLVSGDLMRSIKVVRKAEVEGKEIPQDLKRIPKEVWEDDHLDRHGNYIKPKNRG